MDKLKLMQEWLDHAQAGPALSDLARVVNHPALRDKEALDRRYENVRAPWLLPEYDAQSKAIRKRLQDTTAQEWLDMGIELEMLGYMVYGDARCGEVFNGPLYTDGDLSYVPLLDTPAAWKRLDTFVHIGERWQYERPTQKRGFWQRLFGS